MLPPFWRLLGKIQGKNINLVCSNLDVPSYSFPQVRKCYPYLFKKEKPETSWLNMNSRERVDSVSKY